MENSLTLNNCTSIIVTDNEDTVLAVIDKDHIVEADGIKVILSKD